MPNSAKQILVAFYYLFHTMLEDFAACTYAKAESDTKCNVSLK